MSTHAVFRTGTALAWYEVKVLVFSRWLVGFTVLFAVLASGLVVVDGSIPVDASGLNRFTATYGNLVVVLASLFSICMASLSFAGDRADGQEALLRSSGVSRNVYLTGKYIGLSLTVIFALSIGTGISLFFGSFEKIGLMIIPLLLNGVVLTLVGSAWGAVLGVWTGNRLSAIALALLVWFVAVFIWELGLWAIVPQLDNPVNLYVLALGSALNPVEAVRLLSLFLRNQGGAFGAAFLYIQEFFQTGAGIAVALGLILVHVGVPLAVTRRLLRSLV